MARSTPHVFVPRPEDSGSHGLPLMHASMMSCQLSPVAHLQACHTSSTPECMRAMPPASLQACVPYLQHPSKDACHVFEHVCKHACHTSSPLESVGVIIFKHVCSNKKFNAACSESIRPEAQHGAQFRFKEPLQPTRLDSHCASNVASSTTQRVCFTFLKHKACYSFMIIG